MCGGSKNFGEHKVDFIENTVIGETNDRKPGLLEDCFTLSIVVHLIVVDGAIDFVNEPQRTAIEIHNETEKHMLSTKMQISETVRSQFAPQRFFRRSLIVAQAIGDDDLFFLATSEDAW